MKYDFDSCIDRTKVMSIKWSSKLRQEMYGESDVILFVWKDDRK